MPFAVIVTLTGGNVLFEREGQPEIEARNGELLLAAEGIHHRISIMHKGDTLCRFAHVRVTVLGCIDLLRLLNVPPLMTPEIGQDISNICEELAGLRGLRTLTPITRALRERSLTSRLIDRVTFEVPWRESLSNGIQELARFAPTIRYIEENIANRIACGTLADITGLSTTRFHETFKAAFGVSPMEFVIRLRIQRAQELLLAGHLSVAEVGAAAGYTDPYHFSRQFRARCGASPSDYRRTGAGWVSGI